MINTLNAVLDFSFYGINGNSLLTAILVLVIAIIATKIVYYAIKVWVRKLTQKTKSQFDDLLLDLIEDPVMIIVFLIALQFAFGFLSIENAILIAYFQKGIVVAWTLAFAWLALKITSAIVKGILIPLSKKTKSSYDDNLVPLFSKAIKLAIVLGALIYIIAGLGYDITALVAGLGIGGLALAFAAQQTISNIFGGISLIFDKAFKVGDKIEVDGIVGLVDDISIRSTKIKTFDNELIIIPNSIMANAKIKNFALPALKTRGSLEFGVAYGTDIKKVKKIVLDLVNKHELVLKEPLPEIVFIKLGVFSLDFVVRYWCANYNDIWAVKFWLTEQLYIAFKKAKIEIPFPSQVVYLKKN